MTPEDLNLAIKLAATLTNNPQENEIQKHIIKKAEELGVSDRIPDRWDPFTVQEKIDNWWEDALEKQASLKPKQECKMCRLIFAPHSERGTLPSWMGTLCARCGQARLIHRAHHPHIYDAGNKPSKRILQIEVFTDCEGFEEPDYSEVVGELDNILNAHSTDV